MSATIFIGGDPSKLDATGYTFGDIIAADVAGDLQPVAVGPDGDVLTADSVALEGVDWQPGGGGGGGTPSNTVVTETTFGQASNAGAATAYSRGDHTHGTPTSPAVPAPGGSVVTEQSFGQGSAAGVSAAYSRTDHTHGTPAAPTVPTASGTVSAETTYGIASAAGAAATFSRGDHTHGSPSLGVTSTTAAAGNDPRFTLAPGYYPLSNYGFISMTGEPIGFITNSGLSAGDLWLPQTWVPAGAAITGTWVNIRTTGAFTPTANFNGGVIYEANGTQSGITADDPTLWDTAGWQGINLVTPVAAQTVGRFVRVGLLSNGWAGLSLWYAASTTVDLLNGGAIAHRRNILLTGQNTMPASINPASDGTTLGFLPPFALA